MKAGWQSRIIGDVCEVIAGQSPEGKYYNNECKGIPFYQGKKEFSDKFIGKPTTWTTNITKEAKEGDILMSVRAPVGPVNFSTERICIGRGLAAIRATKDISRDFLFYFLQKHEKELVGNTGAVFNSINKAQIENLPLPLPPLPEQQRIVSILDEAFEDIAIATANAEKNLNNARALFDSYLQSVFAQRGEGWEEKAFNEVCVLQRGFDLPTNFRNDGNFPLVSSNGITDSIDLWKVKSPGVATGRSGTIGNVHYIKNDFWPLNTALYVKDFHGNNPRCIFYFLKQFDLGKYSSGAGVPTLNRNNVHSVTVCFPKSVTEQKNIANKLDELSTETKKLESIYRQKLTALNKLKKSILNQAFTGQLH